ncbi:SAG family member (sag20) [Eimeria tenella]|uniref:SAG family member (Sag20) n=1 Tax=Eimeria tenella TaxID=5802 RepID=Q70CC5_EIMTE|nr:SAG family member (sag20) [Eimeria tenella]CAE52310.1 surface antigen 20 [Eimeria tenella]CDJ43265.1 SAG family member (sag20) [Eimeria tenella]|eukprot:XP_013234015.1 SAG family member (sag20) [Eimeria tenella]
MTPVALLTCYAGLLASAAAPHFSSALSLRSGTATSQQNSLHTNSLVPSEDSAQAATPPTAEEKTDDCLTTINKLRSENLKSLLGTLTEAVESEVTESLKKIGKTEPQNPTAKTIAVKLAGNDIQSCESGESAKATTYPGLVIPFPHSTNFDCNALIQATYTAGLDHLKQSKFEPSTGTYDAAQAPFDNINAGNVAFLLSAESTKVSCAATNNCKAGYNVLFCYFIDPLQKGQKPFTTELYNALWGLEAGAAFISAPSVATVLLVLAVMIRP